MNLEKTYNIKKGFKLKEIHVNDYKILKDLKLNFCDKEGKPLPIVVLAGINGSGKTSVLEFIVSTKNRGYINGIVNGENKNNIKTQSQKVTYGNNKGLIFGKIFENEVIEKREKDAEIIFLPFDIADFSFVKNSMVEFIDKLIYEEDIKASNAYGKCSTFIKETLKDIKLNIEFSRLDKKKQIFFKKHGKEFSIDELSSGEKNLFARFLYLNFMEIKNKVILIDEPELSLHPSWQNKILKLYENFAIKNNCQIIIATHSPQIIGSSKPEYIRILFPEKEKIKVLDNFERSYGLEFSKVLLEIMGVKELRVPEVEQKLEKLKNHLKKKNWDDFEKLYYELKEILGENDVDLKLIYLEANIKGFRNAKNRKK